MADNIPITSGTGTNIATDEVTTTLEHVQLFKLAYSADGSRVLVPATADGLTVKVQGLVSDTADTLMPDVIAPLSLSTEGRLRVVTASESNNFSGWGTGETWGDEDNPIGGEHPQTAW